MNELIKAIELTCAYWAECVQYYPLHMRHGAFNNKHGRKAFALNRT